MGAELRSAVPWGQVIEAGAEGGGGAHTQSRSLSSWARMNFTKSLVMQTAGVLVTYETRGDPSGMHLHASNRHPVRVQTRPEADTHTGFGYP